METIGKFRNVDTGKRNKVRDYSIFSYDNLIIFEFFMPLTNESFLRSSLDALFYKDSVMKRLKSIDIQVLEQYFDNDEKKSPEDYLESICAWVSMNFGGYSISHVSGRYRAKDLCTFHNAYRYIENGENYLVDETTAVAKFIFPCGESKIVNDSSFEQEPKMDNSADSPDIEREYNKTRYLFFKLFVQNIIEIVNEEDEIWMMESGMRNRLYSWRVV
jgi:hypothetical protein